MHLIRGASCVLVLREYIVCHRRGWFIIIAITFSVTWGFIGSDSEHTMET